MQDPLDTVGHDLDEARDKIAATRRGLQAVLDAQGDVPEFRRVVARLERMEVELDRVEVKIAVREGPA